MRRITRTIHEELCRFMTVTCSVLIRMKNVPDKTCIENQNTHSMFNIFAPPPPKKKSCPLRYNIENCGRVQQVTDDNSAHARCMLNTGGYKYTLRICNTYCFSTVTLSTRRSLKSALFCLINDLWCIYECCQSKKKYTVSKEHL